MAIPKNEAATARKSAKLVPGRGRPAKLMSAEARALRAERGTQTTLRRATPPPKTGQAAPVTTAADQPVPKTELWQARVGHDLSVRLLEDAELMGLGNKTEIVKAALELLHRHASELRMSREVETFYRGQAIPLPAGVVPFDPSELDDEPDE